MAAVELNRLLDAALRARWNEVCIECDAGAVAFDAAAFARLPAVLRKLAVRQAAEAVSPELQPVPALTRGHYDTVSRLAEGPVGTAVSLPGGVSARREHGSICLRRGAPPAGLCQTPLPVPGTALVDGAGLRIVAEVLAAPLQPIEALIGRAGPREVFLSLDALALPLIVRGRQPGDRFHPLGAPGERKLKDFFINRKVARRRRDRIPLVVDARGCIAWVVGHEIAGLCRLAGPGQGVLHLRALPSGAGSELPGPP